MIKALLYILYVYFLAGAVLIDLLNRRRTDPQQKRQAWAKYFLYFAIVSFVLGMMWLDVFRYCAVAMTGIGFAEIIAAWRTAPVQRMRLLVIPLLVFTLLCAGFLYAAFSNDPQHSVLMYLYCLVVIFDGFSQLSGQLFGKRPLAPAISPAKTWGGFNGGLLMTMLSAGIFSAAGQAWDGMLVVIFLLGCMPGVAVAYGALTGDLLASAYKRRCGIKDYGSWIPGHGGLLDRFDSFIFVAGIAGWIRIVTGLLSLPQ